MQAGTRQTGSAKLTILPKPAPGTTPPALPPPTENTPPANPTGLTGKGGDRRATLKWTNPKDSDFAAVEIERGTNAAFSSVKATGTVVYHGTGTSYVDKGLTNDVSYRYVVHSLDKNGNKSAGVPINITPHLQLLQTPPDGARLATIPKKFVWTRDPKAAYYNFQLFLGGSLLLQSTDGRTAEDPEHLDDRAVSQLQEPLEVGRQELQDRQGHLHLVRLARLRRARGRQLRPPRWDRPPSRSRRHRSRQSRRRKRSKGYRVVETAIQRSVAMRLTIGRKASGAATERDSISRRPCR